MCETSEDKIIPATYDFVFKKILTDEDNKPFLARIIHLIVGIPYQEIIENMVIQNNEFLVDHENEKKSRADIVVMIGKNKLINIEMNKDYYNGIIRKNYHYLQRLGSIQYGSGDNYKDDKLLCQINFDNYHKFQVHRLVTACMIQSLDEGEIENESVIIYHIDLEYMREVCYNEGIDNLDELERICMLMITESKDQAEEIAKGDPMMEDVTKKLEEMHKDVFAAAIYDGVKQDEMIRKAMIETAIEDGLEQGLEQGSRKKQLEIATNMMKSHMDLEMIKIITGLSIEEIKDLEV